MECDCFYNSSPDGKWPVESVIVKELIPYIDKTYRTIRQRQTRAIEGYSMGGYGAAHLGFKYPDFFGIVGIMAGALITPRDSAQPAVFQKMFGSDPAYVQANDPFALVRKNTDSIRGKTVVRIAVGDGPRCSRWWSLSDDFERKRAPQAGRANGWMVVG